MIRSGLVGAVRPGVLALRMPVVLLLALELATAVVASAATAAKPKHFIVALVDDLGGYNVPWRNPEQRMADDLVQLSTAEGMRLENFCETGRSDLSAACQRQQRSPCRKRTHALAPAA